MAVTGIHAGSEVLEYSGVANRLRRSCGMGK